jgi:uncharacterized protein DUF5684
MLVFMLLWLAFVVFLIAAQWKVYEKAGQPGWAAIVPIYNIIVLLKIVGKPTWWIILFLIPGVNLIFAIWTVNMLSKSFGKDEGFTIGLLILGFIFYPVLGFGSAQYIGPYGDQQAFQAAQDPTFDFNGK